MLNDDILAPGWEWRGSGKVRRGRKYYIRVKGNYYKYVGVGRGDYNIYCPGGYPYIKLAVLTHYDDEIKKRIRRHKREIRRNVG